MTWIFIDHGRANPRSAHGEQAYDPAERARDTTAFLRLSGPLYTDMTVRILTLAENGCEVSDRGGIKRIIKWEDMSYASQTIVRELEPGHVCMLKVRKWV